MVIAKEWNLEESWWDIVGSWLIKYMCKFSCLESVLSWNISWLLWNGSHHLASIIFQDTCSQNVSAFSERNSCFKPVLNLQPAMATKNGEISPVPPCSETSASKDGTVSFISAFLWPPSVSSFESFSACSSSKSIQPTRDWLFGNLYLKVLRKNIR